MPVLNKYRLQTIFFFGLNFGFFAPFPCVKYSMLFHSKDTSLHTNPTAPADIVFLLLPISAHSPQNISSSECHTLNPHLIDHNYVGLAIPDRRWYIVALLSAYLHAAEADSEAESTEFKCASRALSLHTNCIFINLYHFYDDLK